MAAVKNKFVHKLLNVSDMIKKELFRKTIHMMSSFLPFFYYFNKALVMIGLLSVTLLYFISEVLRYNNIKIPIISGVTELAARSRDEGKIVLGPITLALGVFLSFTFFDYRIAIIAIFALSFGDGVASLFGKIIEGPKIPLTFGKTVSGSLGCFIVLFIVYLSCGIELKQSFLIALFATVIEAFPSGDYDNLLIPVATGLFAQNVMF